MSVKIPSAGRVVSKSMKVSTTPPPMEAVGGVVNDITINDITYRVHSFTATGILTVTTAGAAQYLVVAAGGGGGSARLSQLGPFSDKAFYQSGGGGGAGGVLSDAIALSVGNYEIIVGAGGAGGFWPGSPDGQLGTTESNPGTTGDPSKIAFYPGGASLVESYGGGGGGAGASIGLNGGSGGGGGVTNSPYAVGPPTPSGSQASKGLLSGGVGTVGQGNDGSPGEGPTSVDITVSFAGGGGGAGSAGGGPLPTGAGGIGRQSNITSIFQAYATGGSGGGQTNGFANTGNGGGGGSTSPGGSGGSGIVIIRYRIN
jgi:hypothetical protein